MNKKSNYFALAIVWVFGLLVAPHADADYYCRGKVSDNIYDNIIVAGGAKCFLNGSTVEGNLEVEAGGKLKVKGATINGNISAEEAKYVEIKDTYVSGNVQIARTGYYENTRKKGKPSEICNSTIGGDVQLEENYVPFEVGCEGGFGNNIGGNLQVTQHYIDPKKFKKSDYAISIQYNEIDGDLQLFENQSMNMDYSPLNIWIFGNKVYQNLQCNDNYPGPLGEMNFVGGEAQDQCEGLAFTCR
jgi:hypothetical protein